MVEWEEVRREAGIPVIRIHGSNDMKDWVYNFLTGRTIGSNIRVNKWDRYEALIVLRQLRTKYGRERLYHIFGHSRGGAIAQIVAYELGFRCVIMRVYGSKRAGNRRFVEAVFRPGDACYRHRGDWVPWLPPWYARLPNIVFGQWLPLGKAHDYNSYKGQRAIWGD
jgi:pimeloyl-ACP methyl ester carboxylesterase